MSASGVVPSAVPLMTPRVPGILFSTLLPKHFGRRREDRNLAAFVAESTAYAGMVVRPRLLIASAHADALNAAGALLEPLGAHSQLEHIPFQPDPAFNERRAHEIAFCKQALTRLWRDQTDYDVLLYLDADIYVPFAQIAPLADLALADRNCFVNIPYVIHERLETPNVQFGAYVHSRELLHRIDYSPSVYQASRRGDKIVRIDAPDCAARKHLLRCGAREIRAAAPAYSLCTRHYSDNGTYGLYDAGRMSRHRD